MAERAGFEPAIQFPIYALSRRAPSTTRTPLQGVPQAPNGAVECRAAKIRRATGLLCAN